MAQLAIKGHQTRGKEVIEILEMLGGNNPDNLIANFDYLGYFIGKQTRNIYLFHLQGFDSQNVIIFTLEEFLEKFAYKVGDKVQRKGATYCDPIYEVEKMQWVDNHVEYTTKHCWYNSCHNTFTAEYLQPYKEETMEENLTIQDIRDNNAEWLLNKLQEMSSESALQTINDLYGELHKPQYPKTYEECCSILNLPHSELTIDVPLHYSPILISFTKLLICRDAYWKIAGEQMGLGEPWAPVYTDDNIKYSITTHKNRLDFNGTIERNYVLIFPTKEIKNAFYENFKELIEKCKELL
jgi:hypothetical protein